MTTQVNANPSLHGGLFLSPLDSERPESQAGPLPFAEHMALPSHALFRFVSAAQDA